jgi:predicted RNA binding protein YcfA (HicA-like mRNA interferase family)
LPKLKSVSHNELLKGLRSFAFEGTFSGGKHLYMVKGSLRLTIPNPHREKIGVDLLLRILRQAGIAREEWSEKEF